MNSMTNDYVLCGWRLRSAITLPELPPWTGDDREPDVTFALGKVPISFDTPVLRTPMVEVDGEGRIRLRINSVCDYLVERGNRITFDPKVRLGAPDIRLFLLGTGLGFLCHQRGVLPLHAAAVEVDGRTVLLAGPSGVGKSTLAAAFLRRGHRILSDDVAPLAVNGPDGLILPSLRRIRLWRDSAEQAAWPVDTLEPCRDAMEKYSRPLEAGYAAAPLQPSTLVHLRRSVAHRDEITFERLRGARAVEQMRLQTYRWRTLAGLLNDTGALRRVSVAAAVIPHHLILMRPMRYGRLDATIDAILHAVRDAA